MRSLIRPFLFTAARLGLFLAVVAWIFGQWWNLFLATGFGFNIGVGPLGVSTVHHIESQRITWHCIPVTEADLDDYFFVYPPRYEDPFDHSRSGGSGFGITYLFEKNSSWVALSYRHWLITIVFLTFNVLLHFIYRKRPEAEPWED